MKFNGSTASFVKKALAVILALLFILSMSSPFGLSAAAADDEQEPVQQAEGETPDYFDKDNLSEAEKKISTRLLWLAGITQMPDFLTQDLLLDQMIEQDQATLGPLTNGQGSTSDVGVYVYISFEPGTDTDLFLPYVSRIVNEDIDYGLAAAWVGRDDLVGLAGIEEVKNIREVIPPIYNTGVYTTEGDSILKSDIARAQLGADGSGVKIGVISDGVDHYLSAVSTGDLPAGLHVLSNEIGGDEGTAMLEIIHDMAPGAELYFHDAGHTSLDFNDAITELAQAGCDIICDDIAWPNQPFFEDGIIALHIEQVIAAYDAIYVSSAGNFARHHFQGMFYNDGTGYSDFSYGTDPDFKGLVAVLGPYEEIAVVMQWDDPFGGSSNDYDLVMSNIETGNILAVGADEQSGDDYPYEFIVYQNPSMYYRYVEINAFAYDAPQAKNIEIFCFHVLPENINLVPEDSIFGHQTAEGVVTVGAINYSSGVLTDYSSLGYVTMLDEVRQKPNVCGIDGVRISGAGGFGSYQGGIYRFFGTSAAAPHIAAAAAQIKSRFPLMSSEQIKQLLFSTAVDKGISGFDKYYGSGMADTYAACLSFLYANFDSRGGSSTNSQLIEYGGTITKPLSPVKSGAVFGGWYKEAECINRWSFGSDTLTSDTTLYARWLTNPLYVTFDSAGGSSVETIAAEVGDKIEKPQDPVRTGYVFEAWYKDDSYGDLWDFDNDTVSSDITLYAKWAYLCTVSFESNGGSAVASQSVKSGGHAYEPTAPTKADYAFAGWYKEVSLENIWGFYSDKVTADMCLYAKWSEGFQGSGTQADPYLIRNAQELANLGSFINTGNPDFVDKYYLQTADIDLSVYDNWTPIGREPLHCLTGTYDGGGYTIFGMNTNIGLHSVARTGLFYYLTGTIKNINLEGGAINVLSADSVKVGSLAGYADYATIENCSSSVSITVSSSGVGDSYVGGIVGHAFRGNTIVDCSYSGSMQTSGSGVYTGGICGYINYDTQILRCECTSDITAESITGGIVGIASGDIYNYCMVCTCSFSGSITINSTGTTYIGGIIGIAYSTDISGCTNTGDIAVFNNSENFNYIGGVTGFDQGSSTTGCSNSGRITINSPVSVVYSGGITGGAATNESIIRGCYNEGDILINSPQIWVCSGGITGYIHGGEISECYNTGDIYVDEPYGSSYLGGIIGTHVSGTEVLYVQDCFNSGNLHGSDYAHYHSYVGGIVGEGTGTDSSYQNCYNVGRVSADTYYGGIAGSMSGSNPSVFTSCHYSDECAQGIGYGVGTVYSRTLTELRQQATFESYDFTDVWDIDEGTRFPVLRDLPYVFVGGVTIDETILLAVGESSTLTPLIVPADAANQNLYWQSSNETVATVSGSGEVQMLSSGTATITVTTQDGSFTDTCEITERIPVSGISLDRDTLELTAGDTDTLTAAVSPADASDKTVYWTSSNESVALVSDGLVSAVGGGTATITAQTRDGGFTAGCFVTVHQPVSGVELDKENMIIYLDAPGTLTAVVLPLHASDKSVVWQSADESIATVTDGVVTAVALGTADITVTTVDGGFTDVCSVTVGKHVTGVSLNKTSLELKPAESGTLTATLEPHDAANKQVSWSTSDANVATVSDGVVTAVGDGIAEITVTAIDSGYSDICFVTVHQPVTGVELTENELYLLKNETHMLTASVLPADATNDEVAWVSSDTGVVTVSGGLISAVGTGTATITVTTIEGGYEASCEVEVKLGGFVSDVYTFDTYIRDIAINTSAADFIANFENDPDCLDLTAQGTNIATGDRLRLIVYGLKRQDMQTVVLGDVDGNAAISIIDYTLTRLDILKLKALNGVYREAADINGDGYISIIDYTLIRLDILGLKSIH